MIVLTWLRVLLLRSPKRRGVPQAAVRQPLLLHQPNPLPRQGILWTLLS